MPQSGESPEPILPPWSSSTGAGGRPSLYTPALHAAVCALVAAGAPIRTVARQQRIGARTLYDWREKGLSGVEPYVAFAADLDAALAHAETSVVTTIVATTQADWKAGAWWLERRFPKRYGAKQQMRIEKALPDMTDAELEEAIAAHGFVRALPPTDDTPQGT